MQSINLCDSENEEEPSTARMNPSSPMAHDPRSPTPQHEHAAPTNTSHETDEIEIVSVRLVSDGARHRDGDDQHHNPKPEKPNNDQPEVLLVDEAIKFDANRALPHMRFTCAVHPFLRSRDAAEHAAVRLHCQNCFCYVCDKQASTFLMW